jgi:putative proteasome-type protease
MRSNVTVGPPIDLAVCVAGGFQVTHQRRLGADDPDLRAIRTHWEQALRRSVRELPAVRFGGP